MIYLQIKNTHLESDTNDAYYNHRKKNKLERITGDYLGQLPANSKAKLKVALGYYGTFTVNISKDGYFIPQPV